MHPLLDRALALISGSVQPLAAEPVPLAHALGRVLAQPLKADRDQPPADTAAMDGIACRADDAVDGMVLRIVGTVRAGEAPYANELNAGECIRIATGALTPPGDVSVIPQEALDRNGEQVRVRKGVTPGRHILRQGESIRAGSVALEAGTLLGPVQTALCAQMGCDPVPVVRRPQVIFLATGTELKAASDTVTPYQQRDSNSRMAADLLRALVPCRGDTLPPCRDDPDALAAAISRAAAGGADLLCTMGGVSVGERDLIPSVAESLGWTRIEVQLAMKPGKRWYLGHREGQLLLGLPGPPLASLVVARLLGVSLLRRMAGFADPLSPRLQVRLQSPVQSKGGRPRWLPVQLLQDEQGALCALPLPGESVSDLSGASRADGLALLPAIDGAVGTELLLDCLLVRPWPL